jgi:hypothetical protein
MNKFLSLIFYLRNEVVDGHELGLGDVFANNLDGFEGSFAWSSQLSIKLQLKVRINVGSYLLRSFHARASIFASDLIVDIFSLSRVVSQR